ncbi:MAG TPA: glutamine ABC transporter ATP-binding protein [Erwinia sp.]|nr:glutamine ABC transporter ATP-binding protein [Erwinia sp.]
MNGTSMSEKAIEMTGVNKWYGTLQVLKGIDLNVARGEHIVLCGPSGSGKSTLIRCINHLEEIQQGKIAVNGTELSQKGNNADHIRRDVGMVFQQFNLFPHLTVLENCMLAQRRVRKTPVAEARDKAMRHLERVHIAEQAKKFPAQLSGGQQQRVAIARALCMDPKIMLFDEPTSALDPELVGEVLDVINKLARSGVTLVVVTHEIGFARQVADRVVFMVDGKIVESGSAERVLNRPVHQRTRRFLEKVL